MRAWSALSATCHCDLSRDADYRTLTSHLVSVSLWFQGQIRAWLAQSKSYCEDNDKVPQPGTYAQDYTPTVVQGARELQALKSRPMILSETWVYDVISQCYILTAQDPVRAQE